MSLIWPSIQRDITWTFSSILTCFERNYWKVQSNLNSLCMCHDGSDRIICSCCLLGTDYLQDLWRRQLVMCNTYRYSEISIRLHNIVIRYHSFPYQYSSFPYRILYNYVLSHWTLVYTVQYVPILIFSYFSGGQEAT